LKGLYVFLTLLVFHWKTSNVELLRIFFEVLLILFRINQQKDFAENPKFYTLRQSAQISPMIFFFGQFRLPSERGNKKFFSF
jgi:hypothetical protein